MSKNLFGLFLEEIEEKFKSLNLKKFRAKQFVEWMYLHGELDFANMTNIPKAERELLGAAYEIKIPKALRTQEAKDQSTSKFLLGFDDGTAVETVLMRHDYGNSVCVSSQVGCAMGCAFCASTLLGVERNLTGGEIFAQVFFINQLLKTYNSRINNIVIMGSGEPLANYENVLRFIKLCHQKYSLNLSYRSITLSTSGLVPQIYKLADEGLPITLSISLHAPNDSIRSSLMPVNKRYPIEQVISAGDYYADKTGRRVTYEYILIADVNDQADHAKQLAALLKGRLANVNVIPINPVQERGFRRPDHKAVQGFINVLTERHINVTLRREMGSDISAACGQLRHKVLTGEF